MQVLQRKNPNANLMRYRPLFFVFGLVIALVFVGVAFSYSTKVEAIDDEEEWQDSRSELLSQPVAQNKATITQPAPPKASPPPPPKQDITPPKTVDVDPNKVKQVENNPDDKKIEDSLAAV